MPGRILLVPVFICFIILLGYGLFYGEVSVYILLPFLILAIGLYIIQYRINDYWYSKHPPKLGAYEKKWCLRFVPFYPKEDETKKENFNILLSRELRVIEFIPMGFEVVGEEMKMMSIVPAIRLGLANDIELIKHYNRIVLYPHPFISPAIDQIHINESHKEDGVLIFSVEQLNAAYLNPNKYLNPALYQWAEILWEKQRCSFDLSEEMFWSQSSSLFNQDEDFIRRYFGLPNLNINALLIYAYIMSPAKLNETFPVVYNKIKIELLNE